MCGRGHNAKISACDGAKATESRDQAADRRRTPNTLYCSTWNNVLDRKYPSKHHKHPQADRQQTGSEKSFKLSQASQLLHQKQIFPSACVDKQKTCKRTGFERRIVVQFARCISTSAALQFSTLYGGIVTS